MSRTRILIVLLAVLGAAPAARSQEEPPAIAFRAVDLIVTSGDRALAAYQVEVRYDREQVKIVGLESGEPQAFGEAPYYDPAGMSGGRIVVAAFVGKDEAAPMGRVRVARLHLAVEGGGAAPRLDVRLVTAAEPGGARFEPGVELTPVEGK